MSEQKFYKVSYFALPIIPSEILQDKIQLDEYIPEDIGDELLAETRYQILQKLNNAKGASDIKRVLSKEEKERHTNWIHFNDEYFRRKPLEEYERYPILSFEPIMFSYKMPLALQDPPFPAHYPNESFRIILDGVSIFLAGLSPIGKIPSGIPEVRDRIASLINEPRKMICSARGLGLDKNFVFVPSSDVGSARKWDVLITTGHHEKIDANLKMLYLTFYESVNTLFDLHLHLSELREFTAEINELQQTIFNKISKIVEVSSWHVLTRNSLIEEIEKIIVNAFRTYSEFAKRKNLYPRIQQNTFHCVKRNELLSGCLEDLVETYKEPPFNEQLFHQSLDKAQRMFETYSMNRSNIIAGAIGGVIVFVLAQIISYLASLQ